MEKNDEYDDLWINSHETFFWEQENTDNISHIEQVEPQWWGLITTNIPLSEQR